MRERGQLPDIEHWFVQRGVPHFIERKVDSTILDAWTRALPLLVAAYLLLALNALDLGGWSVAQNLLGAVAIIAIAIATWALSNRLRGVATFARPTDIDAPELVLFIVGPTVPAIVFGQFGDALQTALFGVVLLALIYVWTSYGVGPLILWGVKRGAGQLAGLGSLVARGMPLLLVFNTFLFINAEVWEVAGTLDGTAYVVIIATFVALGAAFAASRVPEMIRGLNQFDSWDDVSAHLAGTPAEGIELPAEQFVRDPLRIRQRANIGLVVLFGQALQIVLVVASLVAFFVFFGFFAITEATAAGWTRLDDVNVLSSATVGGRSLVVSEPLVRVAGFLGAFSGMYFTVLLTTDDTYRREFADDVGPQIREALAVRTAYRVARGTHPQVDGPRQTDGTP